MNSGLHWTALPADRLFTGGDRQRAESAGYPLGGARRRRRGLTEGSGAADRVRRAGAKPEAATGLALVTQVGRSFQDEHPDVRVLVGGCVSF